MSRQEAFACAFSMLAMLWISGCGRSTPMSSGTAGPVVMDDRIPDGVSAQLAELSQAVASLRAEVDNDDDERKHLDETSRYASDYSRLMPLLTPDPTAQSEELKKEVARLKLQAAELASRFSVFTQKQKNQNKKRRQNRIKRLLKRLRK